MFLNTSNLPDDVLAVEEMAPSVYILAAIALGFIGFFGFSLNLLVILTVVINANVLWTPNNMVLVNMVVGDLLVAILGNPVSMMSAISGAWYWSDKMCLWYAWFMSTMGFASIGNLTVMAMERYLLVKFPMKSLSKRNAYLVIFLVWIYAFCLSIPPFFNWGVYGFEAGNISCSVSWNQHDPKTHNDTYIGFLFVFGFFLPITLISFSYCGMIGTMKSIRKRLKSTNRRETKITQMVYLMITAFLIAWTPYAIFALASQYFYVQISSSVAVVPALLAKSSICYNPIIYASMNAQFSRFWKNRFFPKTTSKVTTNNTAVITKIEMKNFNRQQPQTNKSNDSTEYVSLK
ncbi:green-sensitive opsin-like [Pseudomyrmex gracilis]|uniref:green-sensitive opsin-like n=1 Tax=Pseudomyrmex gracilis TaxID=219809 RepID=UPI000994A66D|nr:green-sensitive opsin-like [Pseudomyrmex gracilis]